MKPNLLPYLGRFILLHLVIYYLVSFAFLAFQGALPQAYRTALDLYEPFRPPGVGSDIGQFLRGLAFALVFYPFYNTVFRGARGKLILFSSMWGVALFGSVEPQPGSIEGIIYTTISFWEHTYVLIAVGVQMMLFVWLFFKWERYVRKKKQDTATAPEITPSGNSGKTEYFESLFPAPHKIKGYTIRFTIVHLVTYWVIGSIFYEFAGYREALETLEIFELWRPLETIPTVLLVIFGQIFRAVFLALFLYPFYNDYIIRIQGWWLLFWLLFGLTALGSPIFLPEFILFEGTFAQFFMEMLVGIPEIFTQMLIFSVIFFLWQKKHERKAVS